MADNPAARVWTGRAVYLALAAAVIFVQLLPIDTAPARWAAPDLLLALTLAFVVRRPEYVPFGVVIGVFFLTDLLFQRPPGLWAALVLLLTEALRSRSRGLRNVSYALEWGSVAVGIVVVTLANRLALLITMMPQAPLALSLIQMAMTIAVYPLVVAVAHLFFGLDRPAPGQVDSLGHRL
ncbi:rod shape-determining protein MreD [Loktanella fryxellensis]|uniref:Rod shape-determining protein MreD n=1 Tax=Loktanella fryxellensis TaxID=245187 RepID=A0A1H8B3M2_9RHOB|nr:rod shape-determining protein MreD [Loktanella fryxellensis]SEM76688.1 rod shape-determining protein MreD [Loktanella fryxellensis]